MDEREEAEGVVPFDTLSERCKWPRREGELENDEEGFSWKVEDAHLRIVECSVSRRGETRQVRVCLTLQIRFEPDFPLSTSTWSSGTFVES